MASSARRPVKNRPGGRASVAGNATTRCAPTGAPASAVTANARGNLRGDVARSCDIARSCRSRELARLRHGSPREGKRRRAGGRQHLALRDADRETRTPRRPRFTVCGELHCRADRHVRLHCPPRCRGRTRRVSRPRSAGRPGHRGARPPTRRACTRRRARRARLRDRRRRRPYRRCARRVSPPRAVSRPRPDRCPPDRAVTLRSGVATMPAGVSAAASMPASSAGAARRRRRSSRWRDSVAASGATSRSRRSASRQARYWRSASV